MNVDQIRAYCLAKPGVAEGFPFGNGTLVFKVKGKMFCAVSLDSHPLSFNVKCDPDEAVELRERYASVQPGYHMNKKHWNTVLVDGTIPERLLRQFLDASYDLVA